MTLGYELPELPDFTPFNKITPITISAEPTKSFFVFFSPKNTTPNIIEATIDKLLKIGTYFESCIFLKNSNL